MVLFVFLSLFRFIATDQFLRTLKAVNGFEGLSQFLFLLLAVPVAGNMRVFVTSKRCSTYSFVGKWLILDIYALATAIFLIFFKVGFLRIFV